MKQFISNKKDPTLTDVFTEDGEFCGYIGFVVNQNGRGFYPDEDFVFGPEMLLKIINKITELDNEKS